MKLELTPTVMKFANSTADLRVLVGSFGEGKCFQKGTLVLMFDGSLRKIENVKEGDFVMGDDSGPRKVLYLHSGTDEMFEVKPKKGQSFVVTGDHLLSLKRTVSHRHRRGKPSVNRFVGDIVNVPTDEFMAKSRSFKMYHKLFRVAVKFPRRPVALDPYFLGLWLGDGNATNTGITTADSEIVDYIYSFAHKHKMHHVTIDFHKNNKANSYKTTPGNVGAHGRNVVYNKLNLYNLFNNKHIPPEYLVNSRDIRLKTLAGLVDSDGYRNHEGYQFTLKHKQLVDDIVYLCRSLGFAAYVSTVTKTIKRLGFVGEYHQVNISGDLSCVPCKLERRKCAVRKQIKGVLVTAIESVSPVGRKKYYGFGVDGNQRFLLEDFTVVHNTVGALATALLHTQKHGQPVKMAVIRDTLENIKISVKLTMEEMLGSLVRFVDDNRQFRVDSDPPLTGNCLGIDDAAAMSRLQGMVGTSIFWIEEPAPIIHRANAGISEEVFNFCISRSTRGNVPALIMVSMNPGDENHWTYRRLIEAPDVDERFPLFRKESFFIPPGENPHLSDKQRQINAAALAGEPELTERYVEGKFSFYQPGVTVTPEFNPDIHVSKKPLRVMQGLPGFRFYDAWFHPCVLLGQIYPNGRLYFIDTCYAENVGMKQLLETQVLPLLSKPKWKDKISEWRDIGDPTIATPDQSDNNSSTSKMIENVLGCRFEKGASRWGTRRECIKNALNKNIDGKQAITVCKNNHFLRRTLKGGWHYKKDNTGNVSTDIPDKRDPHSHPGDALSHGLTILLPYNPRPKLIVPAHMRKPTLASSYTTGGARRRYYQGAQAPR